MSVFELGRYHRGDRAGHFWPSFQGPAQTDRINCGDQKGAAG